MINKLYSLLMDSQTVSGNTRFTKMTTPVFHTKKSREVQSILLRAAKDAAQEKLALLASFVCYMVRFTDFGEEIMSLDPVNTYVPVERNNTDVDSSMCISELTSTTYVTTELKRYLDKDIIERLSVATWLDYMAAGCLQMLREVHNA